MKVKSKNFLEEEESMILDFATSNSQILSAKFNNVVTNNLKRELWEDLTEQVNEVGGNELNWKQVRMRSSFTPFLRQRKAVKTLQQKPYLETIY